MLNTWWFNIITYLLLSVMYSQFFKLATKNSKNDGALTILLQFLSGFVILLFIPFFSIQFPNNLKTYILLGISCIFYAIADRANTTSRRGLEVSTYSILNQMSTVFTFMWGIIFFKESLIIKKVFGAFLILIGNISILYKKRKFQWNKYVLIRLLGDLSLSIALLIDVGISDQFNLPIYICITMLIPALITIVAEKVKIKDIKTEFINCSKLAIFVLSASCGLISLTMIRAYQFASVTTIAPLCSLTTILNVLVAYIVFKEHDSIIKKIIASILIILGISLLNI